MLRDTYQLKPTPIIGLYEVCTLTPIQEWKMFVPMDKRISLLFDWLGLEVGIEQSYVLDQQRVDHRFGDANLKVVNWHQDDFGDHEAVAMLASIQGTLWLNADKSSLGYHEIKDKNYPPDFIAKPNTLYLADVRLYHKPPTPILGRTLLRYFFSRWPQNLVRKQEEIGHAG